jgi:hypothetical protein
MYGKWPFLTPIKLEVLKRSKPELAYLIMLAKYLELLLSVKTGSAVATPCMMKL